jgi:DNA-binding GntR family transcriptional regulator
LLVELSGNERIQGLVKTFIDQAHRVRMVTLRLRPKPTASNKDHRAVVRAIAKGDAGKARQIHYEHREHSGKLLASLLLEHGLTRF